MKFSSRVRAILLACLLLAFAPSASALVTRGLLKLGYDTGSRAAVDVVFDNGSTGSLYWNEGAYAGLGLELSDYYSFWMAEFSLAYKYVSIGSGSTVITWTSMPFEILGFYRLYSAPVRVGGGAAYYLNPTVNGTGNAADLNYTLDHGTGGILQTDWLINFHIRLGARWTYVVFTEKGTGKTHSDNGPGITLGLAF